MKQAAPLNNSVNSHAFPAALTSPAKLATLAALTTPAKTGAVVISSLHASGGGQRSSYRHSKKGTSQKRKVNMDKLKVKMKELLFNNMGRGLEDDNDDDDFKQN